MMAPAWALLSVALAGLPVETVSVPVELQAELLAKVVRYDRNFSTRTSGEARVLVGFVPGNGLSERTARQFGDALLALKAMGGVPVSVSVEPMPSAAELTKHLQAQRPAVVAFAPGLEGRMGELTAALEKFDGLSVTLSTGVEQGAVLGFALTSGKPRMVLNRSQARRQNVQFSVDVLRLMRIVE